MKEKSRTYVIKIPPAIAAAVEERIVADGLTISEFARVAFSRAAKRPIARNKIPAAAPRTGRPKLPRGP